MDKKYGDGSNNKYSALRAAAAARQRQRSSGSSSTAATATAPQPQPQPHNTAMDRRGVNHSEDGAGVSSSSASAISKSENDPYHKLQQLKQSLQKQQQQQQRGRSDNAGSVIGSGGVDGGREIINNDTTFTAGQQQHQQTRPSFSAATATPAATPAAAFRPRNSLPHSTSSYSDGASVMPSELGAGAGTVTATSSSNTRAAAAKNSKSVFATPSIQRSQHLGASAASTTFASPQQPTTTTAAAAAQQQQQLPSDEFFGNELASSSNVQYSDGHQHDTDYSSHPKNKYHDNNVNYGYDKSDEPPGADSTSTTTLHNDSDRNNSPPPPPPPKTPLSMMRSVMSNIYKDRTEIEGATTRHQQQQQQQQQGSVGGGLFGTESVPMKDGNHGHGMDAAKNDALFGSDSAVAGGGVETGQHVNEHHRYHHHPPPPSDKSHNVASLAGVGWRRDDNQNSNHNDDNDDMHDYGSATIHNDNNLFLLRRSFPTSSSSCCISYGSEIILRFRSSHILASLSVQLRGGGGGLAGGGTSTATSPGTRGGGLAGGGGGVVSSSSSRYYDKVCFMANESHTLLGGIGHAGMNRFIIAKATSSSTTAVGKVSSEEVGEDTGNNMDNIDETTNNAGGDSRSSKVVCYGDKITLRSDLMKRMLGVQKEKVEGYDRMGEDNTTVVHAYKLEVGCFRREGRFPQANTWTVLRGGSNANVVQLGSYSTIMNNLPTTNTLEEQELTKRRIPVYSGDPIVLRNDWTGGLLSLGTECQLPSMIGRMEDDVVAPGWSLNILTSTYQMNPDGAASTHDDEPLIEFLQRHNQCRPRKTETFQMFLADAPHVPGWVCTTGEEGNDRIYLGGSYLNYPNRHERLEEELEVEVFPEIEDGDQKSPQAMQRLADLPVDVQEKVLLDEVIGAMMGNEGQFLQYRSPEDDDGDSQADDNDDDDDEHPITHAPRFGFASQSVLGGKIDSSLENIVTLILPLCTNYARVNQYVQTCLNRPECGVVARCLCEAMNELLEEYLALVSKLDYLAREGEPFFDHDGSGSRKQLTISMVHVHARPSIRTMSILAQVVSVVGGKKGGELLNSLRGLLSLNYSGDVKGGELLQHLLSRCAAPYANMLQTWLTRGKVNDPYGEFMVEITSKSFRENSVTSSVVKLQGMEWTNWCSEKVEHVLFSFHGSNEEIVSLTMTGNSAGLEVDRSRATLHMSPLLKAYATGKFMRAIHCCNEGGGDPSTLLQKKETTEADEQVKLLLNPLKLSRSINQSYHEASDTLLRILLHDYDLLSSLGFMKKYFLLDQGDFFVDFLDGAEDELNKELPNVLQGRVQNWLSTSIARTSESSQLASNLRCGFQKKSLRDTLDDISRRDNQRKLSRKNTRQKTLSGFEAIAFEFKSVPFPTSIVLSDAQFRIYQLVFRLIFFAKYVERQLVSMWSDHQLLKAMTSLRSACSPTFSLRRRMLHFIQNLVYYLKFDVIEPNWRELENKLTATKEYCCSNRTKADDDGMSGSNAQLFPHTVDDLLYEHNQFLIRIAGQCLITNYDLIDRASKIMTTCLLFSTQIKRFMETTKVHEVHEATRHERSQLRFAKKKSKENDRESIFRANREERTKRCSDDIQRELRTETYRHMITRFDEVFSAHLAEFMKNLNSEFGQKNNAHLSNLSMQLDYNGFVSSTIYPKD